MSSELAVTEPAVAAVAAPARIDTPLLRWAYEAREAHRIAASLARTSFVPASLRGKPEDITAAILAGQELGLMPMATLRSMDVIQGTPALRAHAMRGLVQSHGHDIQLVESSETRCVVRGRRRLIPLGQLGIERAFGEWQIVEWTIERATKLGLTTKEQWRKQPQTMLVARATGEVCRLIASDVLYAMPYAAEELDGEPMASAPRERLTAADLLADAPAANTPTDDPPPVQAAPEAPAGDGDWPAVTAPAAA